MVRVHLNGNSRNTFCDRCPLYVDYIYRCFWVAYRTESRAFDPMGDGTDPTCSYFCGTDDR